MIVRWTIDTDAIVSFFLSFFLWWWWCCCWRLIADVVWLVMPLKFATNWRAGFTLWLAPWVPIPSAPFTRTPTRSTCPSSVPGSQKRYLFPLLFRLSFFFLPINWNILTWKTKNQNADLKILDLDLKKPNFDQKTTKILTWKTKTRILTIFYFLHTFLTVFYLKTETFWPEKPKTKMLIWKTWIWTLKNQILTLQPQRFWQFLT